MKVPFTLGVVGHFGLAVRDPKKSARWFQRVLGLLILIVAILIPILGLDRHRRMIDWWIARPRTMQIVWGAATFVFGILLIYLIL